MLSFKIESMKKYLFIIIFQCSFLVTNYAQVKVNSISSVGIGTDTISQSAKLEVHSNSKGFLKPRMDTAARKAIGNKVPGLEVYDTYFKKTFWWDGTNWVSCGNDLDSLNEIQVISLSGTTVSLSKSGGSFNLPAAAPTDLTISGTSSPVTINSSTGSDVTLTAGTNIGLSGSGTNVTITNTFSDPPTNLTFSGSSNVYTLNSSTGSDVTLSGGTGIDLQVSGTDLTINNSSTLSYNSTSGVLTLLPINSTVNLPIGIAGSGTVNIIPKWTTNTTTLGNSQIADDGTTVSIGSTNATSKFHVGGRIGQNFGAGSQLNMAIGNDAGNTSTTGSYNMFFGISSGVANTSGSDNLFFGKSAGDHNTTGSSNLFLGTNAGSANTTANHNLFLGYNAGLSNTTGAFNLFLGNFAGDANTTATDNICIGYNSGGATTTGDKNVFLGSSAGLTNSTGYENVLVGYEAGKNSTGSKNVFLGSQAGNSNSSGYDNVFVGMESGKANSTGYQNTIIGSGSALANTSGKNNLIMGAYSGNTNSSGEMNVILGAYSGRTNTTGSYNIMIGPQNYTGASNTGSSNIFIGSDAGITNTSAGGNIFIGTETGKYNSTGGSNLFIGHSAGKSNTTAYYNTFAGILAGGNNTEGAKNVCLGYNAGTTITTGSENTLIGYYADVSSNNQTNSAAFGNGAVSQASNKIRVGNAAVTEIGGQVGWTTISDKRFKSNIKDDVPGLEFIKKLKPVTYFVDTRMITENLIRNMHDTIKAIYRKTDFNESSTIKRTGFLAQDVEGTCQEIGYDFDGVNIPKDKEDLYSLSYAQFVVPLVKAVQEQELKIEELNIEIGKQKQINAEKDRQLNDLLKRIEIIELKLK